MRSRDVGLKRAVYVLHCFKKKSTKATQTPRPDMDLILTRLKAAAETDNGMDAPFLNRHRGAKVEVQPNHF